MEPGSQVQSHTMQCFRKALALEQLFMVELAVE
jgi:hypothetical protein